MIYKVIDVDNQCYEPFDASARHLDKEFKRRGVHVYRFGPLVGICDGMLEVFDNLIGQYTLGLGKPQLSSKCSRAIEIVVHQRSMMAPY